MTLKDAARKLPDRLSEEQIHGLLELFGEDYFSEEELDEIRALRESDEWVEWHSVRSDVTP